MDDPKTQKLIEKLQKLKAHAESAQTLGNEAEAQAFAEMFQRLLTANKLELTDLEFAERERVDPIDRGFLNWDDYDIPVRSRRVAWIEDLAAVTADAYFCRVLLHPRSSYITLVGRKQDRAIAEYMLVTLVRTVERLADAEYAKYSLECVDECMICWRRQGRVVKKRDHPAEMAHWTRDLRLHPHVFEPHWAKCRGFRPAFIAAFVQRMAQRFWETRKSQTTTSQALVRVQSTMKPIDEWIKAQKIKSGTELSTKVRRNSEGVRRGTKAANDVELNPRAMGSTEKFKQLE